jgi:hypothetical protein
VHILFGTPSKKKKRGVAADVPIIGEKVDSLDHKEAI